MSLEYFHAELQKHLLIGFLITIALGAILMLAGWLFDPDWNSPPVIAPHTMIQGQR